MMNLHDGVAGDNGEARFGVSWLFHDYRGRGAAQAHGREFGTAAARWSQA